MRNRPGRREGLECAPFDLRRATAPAGLANPGSKALGALCDGWAFSPTPIGPRGPGYCMDSISEESTRYQKTILVV